MTTLFGKPPMVIPLGEAQAGDVPPTRIYLMKIVHLNLLPSQQKVLHAVRNEPAETPGSYAAAVKLFKGNFGGINKPDWQGLSSNFDIDIKGELAGPGTTLVVIWMQAKIFQFAATSDRVITAASELAARRLYEPRVFEAPDGRRRITSFVVRPKQGGGAQEYLDFNICVTAPGGPGSDPIDIFIDPKVRNEG